MQRRKSFLQAAAMLAAAVMALAARQARAQALPTATADVHISVFAGVSGNYTDLNLAKNLDLTAGADVGLRPFAGFYPSLEVRGAYPIDQGQVDAQENLVGGLKLGRSKERFHGYGDVLYGRGLVKYLNGGLPNPQHTLLYVQNVTNVLSLGGGVDWDWTRHFGLKGDFQLQKYDSPVSATGELYSKVFTAGLIYRFGTGSVRGRNR